MLCSTGIVVYVQWSTDYSHSEFPRWAARTIRNEAALVGVWSFKLGDLSWGHLRIASVPRLEAHNSILAGSKAGSRHFVGSKEMPLIL